MASHAHRNPLRWIVKREDRMFPVIRCHKTRCIFGSYAIRQKLTPVGASRILVNRPDSGSKDQIALAVVQKKRFLCMQVIPRSESDPSSCVSRIFRVVFFFRSISSTAGLDSMSLIRKTRSPSLEKTASPALQHATLNSKTRTAATKAVRFLHAMTQN